MFGTIMTKFSLFLISWFMIIDKVLSQAESTPLGLSSAALPLSAPGIVVTEGASTSDVNIRANDLSTLIQSLSTRIPIDQAGNILNATEEIPDDGWEYENTTYVDTRRILYSKTVEKGKRPYMVYLSLTKESAKAHKYRGWLCGGVIVDKYYVLTSAACVEDADRFYIVSGTTKFVDSFDYKSDDCVCKHRRKVVWKCIPKNYKFDFQDSIKWSSNDIAIVKVEKPFKFGVQEKGCEFPTDLICYNNISRDLEKPGTKGFIAGWGSGSNFREGVYRRQDDKVHIPENAKCLQEAKVCIMDNEACAKKWAQRFRSIITQYMICTKDVMKRLSELCDKKYANCTDVDTRRLLDEANDDSNKIFNVDLGRHLRDPDDYTARRSSLQGGFCENDHGGPLIVKYQNKERVVGVISACKIDPKTHNCHGPFLYTSVFKNRQFISCAINKDVEENCRRVFRTGITHEEWDVSWEGYKEDDDASDAGDKEMDDNDSDEKNVLRQQAHDSTVQQTPQPAGVAAAGDAPAEAKSTTEEKKADEAASSSSSEESTEDVSTTEKAEENKEKAEEKTDEEKKKKSHKKKKKHSKKSQEDKVESTTADTSKADEDGSGTQLEKQADDLKKVVGSGWIREAEDRQIWRSLREAYVQQLTATG